jgi:transcriptional regulator with PAS, ATPase and Fis domain
MLREVELHAMSDVPILITGESGTGKELLAKAIHLASPRVKFPFTPLNMVSIPGNLFDAEFFGHIKGAFTGADRDRIGYLEYTHRGTLFLDEIGDLPLEFQGKLLRVLQDGEFIKLGTNKSQKVDIRFVAATNQELEKMVAKGTFRRDLYYRLKGTWVQLPPLRERREDIPLLAERFLAEFRRSKEAIEIDDDAMSVLLDFDYPGNIRELRSIIQSAVNLAQGKPITVSCLPGYLQSRKGTLKTNGSIVPLEDVEKEHILKAYDATNKNKVQTARILGIGLNTLRRKLEAYGVD